MIAHRWKVVFLISAVMVPLAIVYKAVRFFDEYYGPPVTASRAADAARAFFHGNWFELSWMMLIVIGMGMNWAIWSKRERK